MSGGRPKDVMFFVFPAFGHIIPLLEIAKKVSEKHKVTFVLTKSYLETFHKRRLLLPPYDGRIRMVGLEDDIPENRDKVYPVPGLQRMVYFARQMAEPIRTLLESTASTEFQSKDALIKPDVVITDRILTSGVVPVCQKLGIVSFIFNPDPGFDIGPTLYVQETTPTVEEVAELDEAKLCVTLSDRTPRPLFPLVPKDYKIYLLEVNRYIHLASGIIINNVRDFDPDAFSKILSHYRIMLESPGFRVFCVGPLFSTDAIQRPGENLHTHLITWLNKHPPRSILYISFGTIATLPAEQIAEFTKAVCDEKGEKFGILWSLPERFHEHVPGDLVEKSRNFLSSPPQEGNLPRVLIMPWTPQKFVLCHRATRLFLHHAGWNSTLEAAAAGVPQVLFPLITDQHANASWITKLGMGFCIPHTRLDKDARIVPAQELVTAFRHVGDWERGQLGNLYFEQVQKWAVLIRSATDQNGSSWKDMRSLIDTISHSVSDYSL